MLCVGDKNTVTKCLDRHEMSLSRHFSVNLYTRCVLEVDKLVRIAILCYIVF